jgi:hypothetical protein
MPISIKSRKAKARRLQDSIRDSIMRAFHLGLDDVKATPMGIKGVDIQLSNEAKRHFPFAVECKAIENINIWDCLEQAETNANLDPTKPAFLLAFKRNNSDTFVAMKWDTFMTINKK